MRSETYAAHFFLLIVRNSMLKLFRARWTLTLVTVNLKRNLSPQVSITSPFAGKKIRLVRKLHQKENKTYLPTGWKNTKFQQPMEPRLEPTKFFLKIKLEFFSAKYFIGNFIPSKPFANLL